WCPAGRAARCRRTQAFYGRVHAGSCTFAGGVRPKYFITICRSFQVSFFCRGSRSKKAGWYVTANFTGGGAELGRPLLSTRGLKSYHRPRSSAMGALIASRVFAATAPKATITLGHIAAIWRIRNGEQVSHSSRSGVRFPGGRHLIMLAI